MASKPKLEVYKEPLRVTIEKANKGYIITKRYGEDATVVKTIDEAMTEAKKCLTKRGK